MRIVSLLPSATEILAAIGATDWLIGRSHECDFPRSVQQLPAVTSQRTMMAASADIDRQVRESLEDHNSLYELDEKLLHELQPDVIITQDLCNVCSIDLRTVERVAARLPNNPTVISLNPSTFEEVFDDMLRVGLLIGRDHEAQRAVVQLRERYWTARDAVNPYIEGESVLFLEWLDPLFVPGHWMPQLINDAGGRHELNQATEKSRIVIPAEVIKAQPTRIILCPCGFSLKQIENHLHEVTETAWWDELTNGFNYDENQPPIVMVDGSKMFNRPGPRLVDAYRWLVGWLNDRPELIPPDFPVKPLPKSRQTEKEDRLL